MACSVAGASGLYMAGRLSKKYSRARSSFRSGAHTSQEGRRGSIRQQRYGFEASAPCDHFRGTHGRFGVVVTALDDHVGMAGEHQFERRVLVERNDQAHRLKRCNHRNPILERIQRALRTLAQSSRRRVAVDPDHKRLTQPTRTIEVGNVAAMQDIEDAVGKHHRSRQRGEPAAQGRARRYLCGEAGCDGPGILHQSMYSNTLTTRCAPLVVRAISAAAAPSSCRTTPIRYTTPRSVTTLTTLIWNFAASMKRAFTLEVMSVSLLRDSKLVAGPTTSSSCTARTLGVERSICSTSVFAESVGTSPVSKTMRL